MDKDNSARNLVQRLLHKDIEIDDLKEEAKETVESYDEKAVESALSMRRLNFSK